MLRGVFGSSDQDTHNRYMVFCTLLVILAAILPYAQTLLYPFIWDDDVFVVENRGLNSLFPLWRFFLDNDLLSSHHDYNSLIYRPLRTLFFSLLVNTVGREPFFFHLVNILFHLGCCLLILRIAIRAGLTLISATLSAVLFAVHPVHTEAVTFISSLGDLMSTFFFLLAFLLFTGGTSVRQIIGVAVIFPLALFSKEMAITFPAWLVACWLGYRQTTGTVRAKAGAMYVLGGFAIAAGYFLLRLRVLGSMGQDQVSWHHVSNSLISLPMVVGAYLEVFLWPSDLCSLRGYFEIHRISAGNYIISIIELVILSGIFVYTYFVKKNFLGLCLAGFWITILPVLNLIPVKIHVAERFLYLPSAALCIALGFVFSKLYQNPSHRRIVVIVSIAVSMALGIRTAVRNTVWRSPLELYEDQISCKYTASEAYMNLAYEYGKMDEFEKAITTIKKALEVGGSNPRHYDMICNWSYALGDYDAARGAAMKSLELVPTNWAAHLCLGIIEMAQKNIDQAKAHYTAALESNDLSYDAHMGLGNIMFREGDYESAEYLMLRCIELIETEEQPYIALMAIYKSRGDRKKFEETKQKLIALRRRLDRERSK